jgi:hypothetical protein
MGSHPNDSNRLASPCPSSGNCLAAPPPSSRSGASRRMSQWATTYVRPRASFDRLRYYGAAGGREVRIGLPVGEVRLGQHGARCGPRRKPFQTRTATLTIGRLGLSGYTSRRGAGVVGTKHPWPPYAALAAGRIGRNRPFAALQDRPLRTRPKREKAVFG